MVDCEMRGRCSIVGGKKVGQDLTSIRGMTPNLSRDLAYECEIFILKRVCDLELGSRDDRDEGPLSA